MIAYTSAVPFDLEPPMSDAEQPTDAERIEMLERQVRQLQLEVTKLQQERPSQRAQMEAFVNREIDRINTGTQASLDTFKEEFRKETKQRFDAEIERFRRASRTSADWLEEYERRVQEVPSLTLKAFAEEVGAKYRTLIKARDRARPKPLKRNATRTGAKKSSK